MRAGISCVVTIVVAGCSAESTNSEELGESSDAYRTFSASGIRASSISKAREPVFKVCIDGRASAADLARSKDYARRSTLTWMRVFKAMDETVTGVVALDCTSPHLRIHLLAGSGRSYAVSAETWIYLTVPFGTWTHELGHALVGLSDTYSGSRAGACQTGQPASLMCWGGYGPRANHATWSTLWDDDIRGAQANYRFLFGTTLTPSSWASSVNLASPIDPDFPYPTSALARTAAPMEDSTEVEIDPTGTLTAIDESADREDL